MLTELFHRVSYLFRRGRFENDLDAEMQFHLEARADELEAGGLPRRAAMAQARREFGPAARMQEQTRSAWQFRRLEDLASDLRYAARSFRRNPAFAVTAITCLALAIGANTTVFSLTNEVLFSRPSVRDADSLISLRVAGGSHAYQPAWRFLRDARIFDGIAGENEESETNWRHGETTERLFAVRVTDNYFEVMDIPLAMGRPIEPGAPGAVISYGLWQRRFGGNPAVVGSGMILDGRAYQVLGVLPRDHRTITGFGFSPDLYLPVASESTRVALFARLPNSMNRATAYARLAATYAQFDPRNRHGVEVSAASGIARISSGKMMSIAAFFAMLLTVAGLVLLIACANVASMLLARASSRGQEIAIRLSIGAGRGRLVRQLLTESLLLAACGTLAGLLLNLVLTTLLSRIRLPLPLPIQFQIDPDWRLMAYSAVLALGTCLAAGLVPAFRATRVVSPQARQIGRGSALRGALVGVQVAVSVVLLCAGLLFVRSLIRASTTNPGFDIEHTVWGRMSLLPEAKPLAVASAGLERLRGLPGVDSAAVARVVPLNDNQTNGADLKIDGGASTVHATFRTNYVSPDYFRVMQIQILAGREFRPQDRNAAIVNETLARRLFGNTDPIGRTITWDAGTIVVVGMAKNSKYFTLGEENMPAYYAPYETMRGSRAAVDFLVRAVGRPEPLVPAVARALGELDRTAAVETKPMSKALVFALLPSRVGAAVLGALGLLGLTLAAIGLYGALLYSVSRRLPEIGLRMALGASPGSVLRLVARQSVVMAGIGSAAGLAVAAIAVRPLALFLIPEVRPTDLSTFAMVAAALFLVTVAATVGPALRALRVDPVTALRHD